MKRDPGDVAVNPTSAGEAHFPVDPMPTVEPPLGFGQSSDENDSINSIEFYFGDISGNFAASTTPAAGAGAQDNGCSAVHFSGAPTSAALWTSVT